MGLLDDAIREHLDLKRRHGDDPTEVARLEQEALGPVRREPEPDAAAEHAAAAASHNDAHHDEPPPARDDTPEQRDEPLAAHAPDHIEHDEPAVSDPRHSDVVNQPTTEFRVEDHHDEPAPSDRSLWAEDLDEEPARHDEQAANADEDVLEETPEFLQETPEHDRLWFEQRPPRDFDFDG